MATLFEMMQAAGVQCEGYQSDLYVPDNETTRQVIRDYEAETGHNPMRSTFWNQVEGGTWLDIPLMFDPFWLAKK